MALDDTGFQTDLSAHQAAGALHEVTAITLSVVAGPSAGSTFESAGSHVSVGSHASNDVVLGDPTVSRFHFELRIDEGHARIRDLESTNGTSVDGVAVFDALLKDGSSIRAGDSVLRCQTVQRSAVVHLDPEDHFGLLFGESPAMRAVFYQLRKASSGEASILLEGETGTGKDLAAEAVHRAGARRDGPFIVIDCGALPPHLIESELFGHEKGAFTGAIATRVGAFESAEGGTVFLDEIGELPLDLQPRLLRVLEQRSIRRVGSSERKAVNFRLIAATHRDLRGAVNAGTFREDLYYRIAVMRVRMPALRERPEDLEGLVRTIAQRLNADESALEAISTPDFFAHLARGAWPGNIRELRNYVEQCLVTQEIGPLAPQTKGAASQAVSYEATPSYEVARAKAIEHFERTYIEWLLRKHKGNFSEAARAAGMDRRYLYRLKERSSK